MEFAFSCPLSSGLHARPASLLAETANQFSAECSLTNLRNGLVGNAKSVLGIIAADVRYQDHCVLEVSGVDGHAALSALQRCVDQTLPTCDVGLAESPASRNNVTVPRVLQSAHATCISGVVISRGIAQGKVAFLRRIRLSAHDKSLPARDPQYELTRVKEAVIAVRQRIGEKLKYAITPVGAAVLQADLAIAGDILLVEKLAQQISQGKSAAQAVVETGEFFIDLLGHSENDYIRQRAADIEEICAQLLEEIGELHSSETMALTEPTILVAESLAPQQLLDLDRRWLQAIVLENAATTSHAAILARSLGIPTLAGARNTRVALPAGREVIVDANRGFVVAQLSSSVRRFYDREQETLRRRMARSSRDGTKRATTKDGRAIEIAANVSSADEATLAFENGADGIGLFRTEMVFLSREQAPSEEEQFAIYSEVARRSCGRPVIIRTFDIGGDKKVPYLNLPREENPFLGYRGSRIYDEHQDLLLTQLRAILRASVSGPIQIMAPMVTSAEEVAQFKAAVAQAKGSLALSGIDFSGDIKIGMMIEVPSAAFMLHELCRELDFFSLGTNDLCQYFFAADRGNAKVSSLFHVRHPAFLRFLDQIVRQIHQGKRWVGLCGEMAADPQNLPLLLGLGLDEISVPASEVRYLQQAIPRWDSDRCEQILNGALACGDAEEVARLLSELWNTGSPQPLLTSELIVLGSASETKEEVIQEMIDAFYVCGRTEDRHALEEALWAREAMGSTELGHGFAIPHCKTDAVTANSICVLRLREPIHWDSEHRERVNMVVLLAVRNADPANMHMQVFSSLARKLINDDFRQHLMKIDTAGEVTAYLARQLDIPLHPEDSAIAERPAQSRTL